MFKIRQKIINFLRSYKKTKSFKTRNRNPIKVNPWKKKNNNQSLFDLSCTCVEYCGTIISISICFYCNYVVKIHWNTRFVSFLNPNHKKKGAADKDKEMDECTIPLSITASLLWCGTLWYNFKKIHLLSQIIVRT